MEKEEKLRSKYLYKIELYLIRIIPMVVAGLCLLNTVLSYIGIDAPIISYIVFFLILLFLYISSYVFKFCAWHRMFLHYITTNTVINTYDYYIGIPVSDWHLFTGYIALTGIFMILIIYLKFKKC